MAPLADPRKTRVWPSTEVVSDTGKQVPNLCYSELGFHLRQLCCRPCCLFSHVHSTCNIGDNALAPAVVLSAASSVTVAAVELALASGCSFTIANAFPTPQREELRAEIPSSARAQR